MNQNLLLLASAALTGCATNNSHAAMMPLASLDLTKIRQGWGKAGTNQSVEGKPLSIGGRKFESGVGTHAASLLSIDLQKTAARFSAFVGIDDESADPKASVEFIVYGDGIILWQSGVMKAGDAAKEVNVALNGVQNLTLRVTDGGDGNAFDHADWADAKIEHDGAAPVAVAWGGERVALTPKAPLEPRINGARVFGVRPGAPLLFKIAASGQKPLRYEAKLPKGAQIDAQSGVISGTLPQKGEFRVPVTVSNARGKATREVVIKVGEEILLTPPMGWNSWYQLSEAVSDEGVRGIARAIKEKGLDEYGWTYVNIDDCWQGERGGPNLALQPNERFPDMKAMTDEIHALGLKAGIYSTPWMGTYAGFRGGTAPNADGTYNNTIAPEKRLQPGQIFGRYPGLHAAKVDRVGPCWFFDRDARQFADWGFDYIKMDWLPNDVPTTKRIATDLRAANRDIALSLSNNAPFDAAAGLSESSNAWRTTGDIHDAWDSIWGIANQQEKWQPYTRPGHWNDPDMLQIGNIGTPNQFNTKFRPTNLTPDEQYFQVSLWSILSAPLLISCDIASLDDFTLGLITNDEVIAVNQDALGKPARKISLGDQSFAWVKPLEDGSLAVGLFNGSEIPQSVAMSWDKLGITGRQTVRDLWRQRDVAAVDGQYEDVVAPHGVKLLKITRAK